MLGMAFIVLSLRWVLGCGLWFREEGVLDIFGLMQSCVVFGTVRLSLAINARTEL
jgi:hypothetical protein